MILIEAFETECRSLARETGAALYFKELKDKLFASVEGHAARFSFDGFNIDLCFHTKSKYADERNTLWSEVVFEGEDTVPFAVYDILNAAGDTEYVPYTFPCLNTPELISRVFENQIRAMFVKLRRFFETLRQNGILKNRLLADQKAAIVKFCENNLLYEAFEMDGLSRRIAFSCLNNYRDFYMRSVLSGGTMLYFEGEPEKALKAFGKGKFFSDYEKSLYEYIKNNLSACPRKGEGALPADFITECRGTRAVREKKLSNTLSFKKVLLWLLLSAGFTAVLSGVTFIICLLRFSGAQLVVGATFFKFAECVFPAAMLAALAAVMRLSLSKSKKQTEPSGKTAKSVQGFNTFLKYMTVFTECLCIFCCFAASGFTAVFYEDYFTFYEDSFIAQTECRYDSVERVVYCEGYYTGSGRFKETPYYIVELENGTVISLYDATAGECEKFAEKAVPIFKAQGVPIIVRKTEDESAIILKYAPLTTEKAAGE